MRIATANKRAARKRTRAWWYRRGTHAYTGPTNYGAPWYYGHMYGLGTPGVVPSARGTWYVLRAATGAATYPCGPAYGWGL